MSKLISTGYSDGGFNFATLALRIVTGVLLIPHGYDKLIHFAAKKGTFMNFLGMGSSVSLGLVIFAELVCSLLILLGLATRLAAIPPIIAMGVALVKAHGGNPFGKGENAALFLIGFLVILVLGPGRMSVDGAMGK